MPQTDYLKFDPNNYVVVESYISWKLCGMWFLKKPHLIF